MVFAIVRYIKGNTLIVDNCPYCHRTHRHGASLNKAEAKQVDSIEDDTERLAFLTKNPGSLGSRRSHCGGYGGEYTLVFPVFLTIKK